MICVAEAVRKATMKGIDMNVQMTPSWQTRIASWNNPAMSVTDIATPTCTVWIGHNLRSATDYKNIWRPAFRTEKNDRQTANGKRSHQFWLVRTF